MHERVAVCLCLSVSICADRDFCHGCPQDSSTHSWLNLSAPLPCPAVDYDLCQLYLALEY